MSVYDDQNGQGDPQQDLRRGYREQLDSGVQAQLPGVAGAPLRTAARHRGRREIESGLAGLREAEKAAAALADPDVKQATMGAIDRAAEEGAAIRQRQAEDRARRAADGDDFGSLRDKLHKGYTGDGGKKRGPSKGYAKGGSLRKRIAIAGAIAGGSALIGFVVFFAMLPLRLTHIVANIEGKYMAQVQGAASVQAQHSFAKYLIKDVIHAVTIADCVNTADPTCRVTPADCTGVWCRVRGAYRDARLERWLAIGDPGLIIRSSSGTSKFTVSIKEAGSPEKKIGNEAQYQQLLDGDIDFFELEGLTSTNRTDLRRQMKTVLAERTKWWQIVKRYKVGELLERKYGVKRCLLACETRDKITASLEARKVAFRLRMVQRMLPEKYGLIMTCVIAGGDECNPDKPDNVSPGQTERITKMEHKLQTELATYLAQISTETLQEAFEAAQSIRARGGISQYIIDRAMQKVVGSILGEAAGKASSKAALSAIPYVGVILTVLVLVAAADDIGPMLSQGAYNTLSATAVAFYQGTATVAAEFKSGNLDWDMFGSADLSFATSLSGDPAKAVDLMQNPYLLELLNLNPGSSSLSASLPGSIFGGTAYAASTADLDYKCDDGQPVPADTLVCPEMNFSEAGNEAATTISEAVDSVPLLPEAAGLIADIAGTPGEWVGGALQYIPGVSQATDYVSEQAAGPMAWMQDQVLTIPEVDSGARQVDMVMAGADIAGNTSCQILLGCREASDQEIAAVRNAYYAEQQAEFRAQPLVARIFSTNSPYSLISRVAMTMPSSATSLANSGVLGLLSNPLARIGSIMSNALSFKTASADEAAQPDPYGIPQTVFPVDDIPSDPEAYWNDNCVTGPLARYNEDTNSLDVSDWLNSDAHHKFDRVRGQMIATTANPCLLIHTGVIQGTAGLFDAELLPRGSTY